MHDESRASREKLLHLKYIFWDEIVHKYMFSFFREQAVLCGR
jgi:hypothetical protein